MVYENLVKKIVNDGGKIVPLYINSNDSNGTGLCNPSILYTGEKLYMILRNVEYTLYFCQGDKKFQSRFEGPLSYYHRDDDLNLRTVNFFCELNKNTLEIEKYHKINTDELDKKPLWNFIGLEDARLVCWDDKFYACGVRRDTTENGQGRTEFSELKITENAAQEINRTRIEVNDISSYCEKNWMPIKDKPFHFIKWTNPTEVVKVDLQKQLAEQIYLSPVTRKLPYDLRGGSQLIKWQDNTYLAIVHECNFTLKNFNGYKDAEYYHRFVIWNYDWSIKCISENFNFMTGGIEFCIGLEEVEGNIIIAFSFQDNCSFALKMSKSYLNELIWKELKVV